MSKIGPEHVGANASHGMHPRPSENPYRDRQMPDSGKMLPWLARVAREAREARGHKEIHIAVAADIHPSTVNRFENKKAWPRDPDEMMKGYAEDLDIHPIRLWERALQLWSAALSAPDADGEPGPGLPGLGGVHERSAATSQPTPKPVPQVRNRQAEA